MVKRAALSLDFTDDEVFNNLIVPLKQNRKLSSVVIKLLTKYYYDDEFRAMLEEEDAKSTMDINDYYEEYFKDVNACLAVMSNLSGNLEDRAKTGLQNIIDTSETRSDVEDDWGVAVPKVATRLIEVQNETIQSAGQEIQEIKESKTESSQDEARMRNLEEKMDIVLKLLSGVGTQNTNENKNSELNRGTPTNNDNMVNSFENVSIKTVVDEEETENFYVEVPYADEVAVTQINETENEVVGFRLVEPIVEQKEPIEEEIDRKSLGLKQLQALKRSVANK